VSEILDEFSNIEKYLCFVRKAHTHAYARRICQDNGMQFYNPRTSDEAEVYLKTFGEDKLGNSTKSQFHVDGPRGRRCRGVNGRGKLLTVSCDNYQYFFCEYYAESIHKIECEFYDTSYNSHRHVTTFPDNRNIIFASAAIGGPNIVALQFGDDTTYLPNDLVESFPNLNLITAFESSVYILSRRTFRGLTKLRHLDLEECGIKVLNYWVFQDLTALEYLNVGKVTHLKAT
jgi:hypothetical protein